MYCLVGKLNTCMGFVRFYPDNRICESLILQYFRQIKLKIKILRINVTTALQKLARAPETYFHSILHKSLKCQYGTCRCGGVFFLFFCGGVVVIFLGDLAMRFEIEKQGKKYTIMIIVLNLGPVSQNHLLSKIYFKTKICHKICLRSHHSRFTILSYLMIILRSVIIL